MSKRYLAGVKRLTILKGIKRAYLKTQLVYRLIFHYPRLVLEEADYDDYWKDKRNTNMGSISSFQKQRADWILPRIQDPAVVLDIGSGDGGVLFHLLKNKNITPIAADISDYALAFLESHGIATIKFDVNNLIDIENLPQVDYIILFEILEHVQNPEKFLRLIEKKARKSVFFSFPNTGFFPYRLRMLLGSFVMQWRLHPGEHLRFWTCKDLKWWLDELGYGDRSDIHIYEGIPFLNKIWGSLFGMAFVAEVRVA